MAPDTIPAGRERGWSGAGGSPRPGPAEDKEAAAQVAPRPAAPGRGPGGLQVVLLSREAAPPGNPGWSARGGPGKRVHLFIASVQGSPIERQRQH